jgi:hypothetical protein
VRNRRVWTGIDGAQFTELPLRGAWRSRRLRPTMREAERGPQPRRRKTPATLAAEPAGAANRVVHPKKPTCRVGSFAPSTPRWTHPADRQVRPSRASSAGTWLPTSFACPPSHPPATRNP